MKSTLVSKAICTVSPTIYDIVIRPTETIPNISLHVGPFNRLSSTVAEDVKTMFTRPVGPFSEFMPK